VHGSEDGVVRRDESVKGAGLIQKKIKRKKRRKKKKKKKKERNKKGIKIKKEKKRRKGKYTCKYVMICM
jgi:methionine-rich copper-binding protein CopC